MQNKPGLSLPLQLSKASTANIKIPTKVSMRDSKVNRKRNLTTLSKLEVRGPRRFEVHISKALKVQMLDYSK